MLILSLYLILAPIHGAECVNRAAEYLVQKVENKSAYSPLIRPVSNAEEVLTVYMGFRLSEVIKVDDREELVTTRLWLEYEWKDIHLTWDPQEFDNIQFVYLPYDLIWLPDIVLFDDAKGKYNFQTNSNAKVFFDGTVKLTVPGVFKSVCIIDVEFFPYDVQLCGMKFGSLTYDSRQVEIRHLLQRQLPTLKGRVFIDMAVDLRDFHPSVEFDLMSASVYTFPDGDNTEASILKVEYKLKRKTFFFTLNLMLPCVAISFLSALIFYLPSESKEKISLSISILLSLILFVLLVAETIPSTSLVVPLIGKYLLFTIAMVTLSIILTVVILNIHFRSGETHRMSPWTRKVFLEILPRIMGFSIDESSDKRIGWLEYFIIKFMNWRKKPKNTENHSKHSIDMNQGVLINENAMEQLDSVVYFDDGHSEFRNFSSSPISPSLERLKLPKLVPQLKIQTQNTVNGLDYIAGHFKDVDFQSSTLTGGSRIIAADAQVEDDWRLVAMLLDRLFLCLFFVACVLSSTSIILRAPTLYDNGVPLLANNLPSVVNVTYLQKENNVTFSFELQNF
ncbi:hypothetical protein Ciccas_006994 [Cichlidogyrus casuarinus]|uniref:Uncharacterized protein n=1 Tax=Cichlidogyrus casuarinus TaxID=1844966 RepID=A0ABD2Q462_9PLAT